MKTQKCITCEIVKEVNDVNFHNQATYGNEPKFKNECKTCVITRNNFGKNFDKTNPEHLKKWKNQYTPNERARFDCNRYTLDIFGYNFWELINKDMLEEFMYSSKGKIHYRIKPEFAKDGKVGTTVPQEKSITNNSKSKKMVQDKQDAPIASKETAPTHSVEETSKISKSLEELANEIHSEIKALSAEITNYSGKLVNLNAKFNMVLAKIQEEKELVKIPTEFSVEDFAEYFKLPLDKGQLMMGQNFALKTTIKKDIKEIVVDGKTIFKFPTDKLKSIFDFAFSKEEETAE